MPADGPFRLAWASDIHLDHADPDAVARFCGRVRASGARALLLGGDIAVAAGLADDLVSLADAIDLPIHFVLGNHDYYGGSVAGVRGGMARLRDLRLDWLEQGSPRHLAPGLALVGEGGWGDARLGDFAGSDVILNDYLHIADLRRVFKLEACRGTLAGQDELQALLQRLGSQAAARLGPELRAAAAECEQVIVLCHVPPFAESAVYQGRMSSPSFLPGFACAALGQEIAAAAAEHPACTFTVLCGHTHGGGTARIAPNLVCHTQAAEYGSPDFLVIEVTREPQLQLAVVS